MYFYPRSPCGERPIRWSLLFLSQSFLSTLSLRRATVTPKLRPTFLRFLSTLSLRRATSNVFEKYNSVQHFYPRSPCGERLLQNHIFFRHNLFLSTLSLRRATRAANCQQRNHQISIHALLAESDVGQKRLRQKLAISIHALLAESDVGASEGAIAGDYFYPRSPCGERRSSYNFFP